jgi:hypothetical protein
VTPSAVPGTVAAKSESVKFGAVNVNAIQLHVPSRASMGSLSDTSEGGIRYRMYHFYYSKKLI